jgi:predicted ribosomally synthesized peptide with SipW-like signal peptide
MRITRRGGSRLNARERIGMGTKRKILLTLLTVGVLGSVAAFGTYAAFTATTTNSGNSFAAGTVAIQDDSGLSTALFNNITNQAPTASGTAKCIRIKYTGSLASTVHFYIPSASNGDMFQIKVERGSGLTDLSTRGSCTGFSASSTAFALADLTGFPTAYSGGVEGKASDAAWAQNDAVDYRFTLYVKDESTANAHASAVSTGSFAITWEAQSN